MNVNFVTSTSITLVIHACQQCFNKFNFRNKLFNHFRIECWKVNSSYVVIVNNIDNFNQVDNSIKISDFGQTNYFDQVNNVDNSVKVNNVGNFNQVEIFNHSAQTDSARWFIKFIDISVLKNDFTFRKFHYVTALIKRSFNNETKNCCVNIDCSLLIDEQVYIDKTFSNVEIKQLVASLLICDIKNIIHNFNKYIVVDVFINNYIIKNNKRLSITNKFLVKIHIVNNFKINLLLNNNVFIIQRVVININTQIVTLISCNNLIVSINTTIKKNVD